MSAAQHSQGPWHRDGTDIVGPDNNVIAHTAWTGNTAETMCNVKVLAAAPELLAVLLELFQIGEVYATSIEQKNYDSDFEALAKKAYAAISKATT